MDSLIMCLRFDRFVPKLGLFSDGDLTGRDFESNLEYRLQNFEVDESKCFLRTGACVFSWMELLIEGEECVKVRGEKFALLR